MEPTRLSELIEELLQPDLTPWFIEKNVDIASETPEAAHGEIEKFDSLTLLESFIESEVDLRAACKLFDEVVARLRVTGKTVFTHREIHATVVDAMLDFPTSDNVEWLNNYDNLFGPDVQELPDDETYVSARSAAELKEFVVGRMCEAAQVNSYAELIGFVGKAGIDAATNRVRKIVRYCGFYKIRRQFLADFCQELSNASIKQLIPIPHNDPNYCLRRLEDAERDLAAALQTRNDTPRAAHTHVMLAIENIGQALLSSFELFPRNASGAFARFVELCRDGNSLERSQSHGRDSHPTVQVYHRVMKRLSPLGVPWKHFDSFCGQVLTLSSQDETSVDHDVLYQASTIGERLLRLANIISTPPDSVDALRAVVLNHETHDEYLRLASERLAEIGIPTSISKTGFLHCDLKYRTNYSELLQFGGVIDIHFLSVADDASVVPTMQRVLSNYSGNEGTVVLFLQETDLPAACISLCRDSALNPTAAGCAIPLSASQFERLLLDERRFEEKLFQELLKIAPELRDRGNRVFDDRPEQLEAVFGGPRRRLDDAWDALAGGKFIECVTWIASGLEELLQWQLLTVCELLSSKGHDNGRLQLSDKLRNPSLGTLLDAFEWCEESANKTTKDIARHFVPPKRVRNAVHRIRMHRNEIVHRPETATHSEAVRLFEEAVKIAALVQTKYWHRRIAMYRSTEEEHIQLLVEADANTQKLTDVKKTKNSVEFKDRLVVELVKLPGAARPTIIPRCELCSVCRDSVRVLVPDHDNSITCIGCRGALRVSAEYSALRDRSRHAAAQFTIQENDDHDREGTYKSRRGRQMRNWLRILAEGIATAAGPLGMPIRMILETAKADQERELNRQIEKIISGQSEVIEAVGNGLAAIDAGTANGQIAAEILPATAERLALLSNHDLSRALALVEGVRWPFVWPSVYTEEEVTEELLDLYADDLELFFGDLRASGFPVDRVKRTMTATTDVRNAVRKCRGQNTEVLCSTWQTLRKKNPGSEIIVEIDARLSRIMETLNAG